MRIQGYNRGYAAIHGCTGDIVKFVLNPNEQHNLVEVADFACAPPAPRCKTKIMSPAVETRRAAHPGRMEGGITSFAFQCAARADVICGPVDRVALADNGHMVGIAVVAAQMLGACSAQHHPLLRHPRPYVEYVLVCCRENGQCRTVNPAHSVIFPQMYGWRL